MKHILLFGAGKSATILISYLLQHAARQKWHVTIADHDLQLIRSKTGKSYYATPVALDVKASHSRENLIKEADLVISLLPPALHILVARDCIQFRKHLLTASYLDAEVKNLRADIEAAGILFLYEMGLDPGLDHMSAMKLIHSIEKKGGQISSFKSYCGGLISPESNDNPWSYKISWNPRNIVMAGSSGALYKEKGRTREIAYGQLFDHNKTIQVPQVGKLAYYPNRDSLGYMELYRLENVHTFMRATLRFPDFCEGWNALVKLGLTRDDAQRSTDHLPYFQWAAQQISGQPATRSHEEIVAQYLEVSPKSKVIRLLRYLGIFNGEQINLGACSNADVLQHVLENKLKMESHDKDLIVMQHEIEFERRNLPTRLNSYLIVQGEDAVHTAMAKTVGLPLGIMAKLLLSDKITLTGLHIPILPEIYNPVLKELEEFDIKFVESFE